MGQLARMRLMVLKQLSDLLDIYVCQEGFWVIANISSFHITNMRLLYVLAKAVWIKEAEFRIIRYFNVSLEAIEILSVFVAIL